jgi:DNA repair photolyase
MEYKLINCNSFLKKITKKDMLFKGKYCTDPYQNCEFGCLYCDSSFEKTIYVKNNSVEILENELKTIEKGVIIIGSVHDPYQKAEKTYELTKKILITIKKYQFPCHILTKSTLIERDIDLLASINCMVTISIMSLDEKVFRIFEKNVPTPRERLRTLKTLSKNEIKTGIALIPLLPYITEDEIEHIIKKAKKNNANHILHKYLELKGEQKLFFSDIIKEHYPNLLSKYNNIYKNRLRPENKYINIFDKKIQKCCKKYKIADKIV